MAGSQSIDIHLNESIVKLTDLTVSTLTENPKFPFPVTVCARHALCVAFQVESLPVRRLRATINANRQVAQQTIKNMLIGRRQVTSSCRMATDNLPSLKTEKETRLRNRAIRNGVRSRLCGYDTAIIYLHALYADTRANWGRVEPLLTITTGDDILARWEHYTGQPLVGGIEDATKLTLT